MKRRALIATTLVLLTVGLARAQILSKASFRSPAGERPLTLLQQDGHHFFAADEIAAALDGKLTGDANGFRFVLGDVETVFGADNRFAVIHDELIEMVHAPIVFDDRPFLPWQFFQTVAKAATGSDLTFDPATKTLVMRSVPREALNAQLSVVDLQTLSKMVIQLSASTEFTINRRGNSYVIRTRNPLRATTPEQTFDDPRISYVEVQGNDVTIQLRSPDLIADTYRLENPFRIVLDVRSGSPAQASGAAPPGVNRETHTPGIRTIVLDPGHGGKETGAIGPSGLMEKDATLQICKKIAAQLQSRLGVKVYLTRSGDEQVPLEQRTALANQYAADLFLSVHLNASLVRGARGAETYFLSVEASDELARKAAESENAADAPAQRPAETSDLRMILWDLAQQDYMKESSRFAELIQEAMNTASGVTNRGVKQAPFKVLVGATMPAALLEIAFISNPEEEARLTDEAFQGSIVKAVVDAVAGYKTEYESRLTAPSEAAAPAADASPAAGAEPRGGGGR